MTQSYWLDGAIQTKPDLSELVSKGYPTNGDRSSGLRATKPGAAWFYLMSLMRAQVIAACSEEEDPTDESQYFDCLKSFGWVPDNTIPGAKLLNASVTPDKFAALDIDDLPESWLNALMPAGEFILVAGTTLPTRTVLCNGAALSRTTYSRLFAVIGTKYGSGDGSTTFNVPNLNGRVLQGVSDTSQVGTYEEASLPNIQGDFGNLPCRMDDPAMGTASGAFATPGLNGGSGYGSRTYVQNTVITHDDKLDGISFIAARSSSIYSGSSLQPSACLSLVAIRF